jgi:hypothetical protein
MGATHRGSRAAGENHTIEPLHQLFPNEPVILDLYALLKFFETVTDNRHRRG